MVAQSRVNATGSIENDGRIATIDTFLQGPAVQKFRESIRQQFQELERQHFVRKLGDGRGQVKRKETEQGEDEEMGGKQGEDWVPQGTHADYVSDPCSETLGCVPDSGEKPVLVSKLPETYGPARNRVHRNTDPDTDGRDHL